MTLSSWNETLNKQAILDFVAMTSAEGSPDYLPPAERIAAFEAAENRFALQARVTTVIVGLTGFYMVEVYDLWDRFSHIEYWWMHGMVIIWVIFTVVLFIAEPLFLHRWFLARATEKPDETFTLVQRLHWVLLSVSLIIVLAAVVGAHGG